MVDRTEQDTPKGSAPKPIDREELDRQYMSDVAVEKTWKVPAHLDKGPVTISLRVPEVKVTGLAGRYIFVSPEQADLVSSRLGQIRDWMDSDDEWVGND